MIEQKSTTVLPYVKGLSRQQQGICAVFMSEITHLVESKDAVEPAKKDGAVYKIPCECSKVYISRTGRPMQDGIREHERGIPLAHTQTSTISEHANSMGNNLLWNEVKFTDRDLHWYTHRVREVIHILHLTTSTGIVE